MRLVGGGAFIVEEDVTFKWDLSVLTLLVLVTIFVGKFKEDMSYFQKVHFKPVGSSKLQEPIA